MSPLERRKARLDAWQNAPVPFASPEAEANYKERIERLRKIYDMEPHDRPIADLFLGVNEYVVRRKGIQGKDMVYNHEKLREPLLEFHNEFQPDVSVGPLPYPGKVMDMLDFKSYIWGGQKLPDNLTIQAVEGEYMSADEYKEFAADPTNFWLKKYLPRVMPTLAPLAMLTEFPRISENVDIIDLMVPFGLPPFQEMLKTMMEAGNELMKMLAVVGQTGAMIAGAGFPGMGYNIVKTPFDYLGDTVRGTKGILTDMYRHPKDLLAACEAYVPVLINAAVNASDRNGAPCRAVRAAQRRGRLHVKGAVREVLLAHLETGYDGAVRRRHHQLPVHRRLLQHTAWNTWLKCPKNRWSATSTRPTCAG